MTPHNEANIEDIASTVIMPGDPKRAKYIADNYLNDYKLVNDVRGMKAYTGFYKGKKVTVMASGMGIPSMGIYSYELFKFYNVDNIIRIGTCGAYTKDLNLYDLILVSESYSESNYARYQNGYDKNINYSSTILNNKILDIAKKNNVDIKLGKIHSSEVFYSDVVDINDLYNNKHCLGVEMETFALFHNAGAFSKNASAILTVSDNIVTNEKTTPLERQEKLDEMIKLALEAVL